MLSGFKKYLLFESHRKKLVMSVPVIVCGWCCMSISLVSVMSTRAAWMSPYLMELNTIVRIIFSSVKSNIRKIEPYREKCCIYQVGKQKLVQHNEYHSWDDERLR